MKSSLIQYLVGLVMLTFSLYQAYIQEYWEVALYATAGAAFVTMGLVKDKVYSKYEKQMTILSWLLIGATVFLFFFLVRTDA